LHTAFYIPFPGAASAEPPAAARRRPPAAAPGGPDADAATRRSTDSPSPLDAMRRAALSMTSWLLPGSAADGRSTSFSHRELAAESTANWVASATWQEEFERRIAVIADVPSSSVELASYEDMGIDGTLMSFRIQPGDDSTAGYAALKAKIASLGTSDFLTSILGVPITSVTVLLATQISPPPAMQSPSAPPTDSVGSGGAIVPGVIVAIVVPIVLLLVLGAAGVWWYRRRKKRIGQVTVTPNRELVAPPSVPEDS